jgi:hypothetical protein
MTPLVQPTLNINSTSARELVEQRVAVMDAARELLKAMQAAAPHARDYPCIETSMLSEAAWVERMKFVEQLLNDVEMDAMLITLAGCK